MKSRPKDWKGIAFITYIVLMYYYSRTQLFHHLLPTIHAWFSRSTSKTNLRTFIASLYVHVWKFITFGGWSLTFTLNESIRKIFVGRSFRGHWLFMTIRINTIDLSSGCFLFLELIVWFPSKFIVENILEKFNHVIILFQKTFALTKLANRIWVIKIMIAYEYLSFFIICFALRISSRKWF